MVDQPPDPGAGDVEFYRDRIRRLEAVVETSFMVNSTLDLRELANHIIEIATRLINAERGSLFLVDNDGTTLRSLVAQGLSSGELTLKVGEGIVGAVAETGEGIILNSPYDDPRFDPSVDRSTGYRTRSLLTAPVRDRDGALTAVLQLLNHGGDGFSENDVAFLAELGVPFAIALTTARMHQEIVTRERMREELRMAAEIQRTLQPRADVLPPGLAIETLIQPCLEVGGDYLDLIPLGDGIRWWLVVADVSGKGVSAGLIAANVQSFLWTRRTDPPSLEEVVAEGNDLLYGLAQGRKFATMVVAEWDSRRSTIRWVSAGHPPIFLRQQGEVNEIDATGRPIGLLPGQDYGKVESELEPGDFFVLYTDGVIEAGMGSTLGEFGIAGVRSCLAACEDGSQAVQRISTELKQYLGEIELDDDLTILCATCSAEL